MTVGAVSTSGLARALSRTASGGVIWLAFLGALVLHLYARGVADNLGAGPYALDGLERSLFGGIPTVWLQSRISTEQPLITWTAAVLHASWFYLPIVLAAGVQLRLGRSALVRLLSLQVVLFLACDAIFAIAPTRPPWMELEVVRVVDVVYRDTSNVDMNPVAAMPSLHVALPALYTIWFARRPEAELRALSPLLAVWTLGVAWSVVYGGEHYMIDAVAGVAWAAVVYAGSSALAGAIATRRPRGAIALLRPRAAAAGRRPAEDKPKAA